MKIDLRLVSPLEKVFLDEAPRGGYRFSSALLGEDVSFQAAWIALDPPGRDFVQLKVTGDVPVRVRRVRSVPVEFAVMPDADSDYLRRTPGLYPDALEELAAGLQRVYFWKWECVWIDIENAPAGDHSVTVELSAPDGTPLAQDTFCLHVVNARLPEQRLIHTKWFHCDGLCQYYGVEMWSERFWQICENFVRAAARRGINMLLTPIHTPPLDTEVGAERMTCQLVDIELGNSGYRFGFEKLERWIAMAQRASIRYFEMAHLFTQWGALHAPKIVATIDGVPTRLFGWDTNATGEAYADFLHCYLEALTQKLRELGVAERCWFHISDEPSLDMLDDYRRAHDLAARYLEGFPILDALSNFAFYETGAIAKPVPATNHIEPFLEANVPGLWTYYCIGQYKLVSNMFLSMPSQRNRILGVQLYKYNIEGFLQWGYNFYNSQGSTHPINPWLVTDGDGFTPAGDAYQVYPGADGQPVESLRMMVTKQAIDDMRALELLESLIGRERTLSLVEEGIAPITFADYPRDADYLLEMRRRVNLAIECCLAK